MRSRPTRVAAAAGDRAVLCALLAVGAALSACAPAPDHAQALPAGAAFPSSQTKPPSSGRRALPVRAPSSSRGAQQQRYFTELRAGLHPDKASLLGPTGAALGAGVRDVPAGPLPHLVLELGAGQTVVAETRDLTQGADTVLHLLERATSKQVAMDDDSGDTPGASRLRYTTAAPGSYVLLLRGYGPGDEGEADLWIDGARRLRAVKLGGTPVPVASGRTLETVLLNDRMGSEPWPPSPRAASDTLLLLIDGRTGDLLALDDDSGVELGSKLAVPAATGRVLGLVGAYDGAAEGSTRLVVNDAPLADADGDRLGDGLEAALCLCGRTSDRPCGFDCRGAQTPQDTDSDGLSDGVEVLGLEHEEFPQLLPRWGADPRHKDVFVEIDLARWYDTTVSPPVLHYGRSLSAEDAQIAARTFAKLTEMRNPDRAEGIRLHLDVGHACGLLASGIDEVCGDLCAFDRRGRKRCGQSYRGNPKADRRTDLAPGRARLFHIAIADCLIAGQSPGAPSDQLEYDCDRMTALVHELGHNLGLARHYGTFQTGGGNCKPNYPSLINYAYSDRFDEGRELQFSDGSLVGDGDLDPRDLDETRPYGGTDADVSWLGVRPFYFPLLGCSGAGRGCKVDWNRDGRLDPSVRANLSPMPNYGYICENIHGNAIDAENIAGLKARSGPAAAEILRQDASGALKPALQVVAPTDGERGSALKVTHTFATSGGWSAWQSIPGPTLRQDAEPAVLATSDQKALWIFACIDGPNPIHVAVLGSDGSVTPLKPIPGQPASLRAREVSVARVGEELALLVRDDAATGADRVYLARHSDSAGWGTGLVPLLAEGAPLRSTVTPALAETPDQRVYVVTGDPDPPFGTGPLGRLHVYSSQGLSAQLVDEELEGLRFADGTPSLEHVPWARPALLFVPLLDGKGQPLADQRGYLALWWTRGTRMRYLWTWGQLDAKNASFVLGRWHHYEAMGYTDALASSGPALALRGGKRLSALISQSSFTTYQVRHVPYADGIPEKELVYRDHDDRPTIRQNVCASLNWDCPSRCGLLGMTCTTPVPAPSDVSCALPRWPAAEVP